MRRFSHIYPVLDAFTEAILNLRHARHLLYAKRTALRPVSRYQIVFLRVFLAILQGLCYHVSYKFKKEGHRMTFVSTKN